MNTKRLRYDEIKCKQNLVWFKNKEILTQRKYMFLQYILEDTC